MSSRKNPKDTKGAENARAAVQAAYKTRKESDYGTVLYSERMHELLQGYDSEDPNPLCVFRYFTAWGAAEWYVYAANRQKSGRVILGAYACLGDPDLAESGDVPLGREGGFGLQDVSDRIPVELDRYYEPRRIREIRGRFRRMRRAG